MTLSNSRRLGPYEILAPLGAGGMGEVYRAKDTRLNRTVAVKVLPNELSSKPGLAAALRAQAQASLELRLPHFYPDTNKLQPESGWI